MLISQRSTKELKAIQEEAEWAIIERQMRINNGAPNSKYLKQCQRRDGIISSTIKAELDGRKKRD
ncbi:MAG: hypothetical protein J0L83_14515 [Chitinophagales bacterium]|nr:hypothetical protein [Chitinophagales bacterium]